MLTDEELREKAAMLLSDFRKLEACGVYERTLVNFIFLALREVRDHKERAKWESTIRPASANPAREGREENAMSETGGKRKNSFHSPEHHHKLSMVMKAKWDALKAQHPDADRWIGMTPLYRRADGTYSYREREAGR
jgi:hypothetical protein